MAERDDLLLAPLEDVEAAIRWLLALADEGGELWMKTKCPHGYDSHAWIEDGESKGCDGSRVRVWPPTEGHQGIPNASRSHLQKILRFL